MKSGTPERIVLYLEKTGIASTDELSRALDLTKPNIHHHIKQLQEIGKVESISPKFLLIFQRGRPKHYYRLSVTARPSNLSQLTSCLLDELFHQVSANSSVHAVALKNIAQAMVGSQPVLSNLTTRLNFAIHFLNQKGYQANWEAHFHGPQIEFKNCPYSEVLSAHPQLCDIDLEILNLLLGISFKQISKFNMVPPYSQFCRFAQ